MTPGARATPSVGVVGAGLSGLTAAYRLKQAGWTVTVLESTGAPGGRVQTIRRAGYQVDIGASAFSGAYERYIALVDELGLSYRPTSPRIAIPRDGRLHELNIDRMVSSGLRTRLLPAWAKLRLARLALDVVTAKRRGQLDYADMRKAAPLDIESCRAYAERVLSPEIDQYLCEPIVRTMLIADTDKVSKVELFSGIANIFASKIFSIQGGQGALTEALAARLDIQLRAPVELVTDTGDHVEIIHRDPDGCAHTARYDATVVAAPLPVATAICPNYAELLGPLNESLGYTHCLKVAIGDNGPAEHAPRS